MAAFMSDAEPLTAVERNIYRHIMDSFQRSGRASTAVEMATALHVEQAAVLDTLRSLERQEALRLEPDSCAILDAYPYSGVPTSHTLILDTGVPVYSMCAIDAFYVPFLTNSDVTIQSRCFYCGADLQIRVVGNKLVHEEPHGIVVWDSQAHYDCPKTNFFCGNTHLTRWRKSSPEEPGQVCTLDEALERGSEAATRIRKAFGLS
jgi:hypothetical protein